MYIQSGLDEALPEGILHNGTRYFIYGDPDCNNRWYLKTPFEGTISQEKQKLNTEMFSVGITVEWEFKEVKHY